MKRAMLISMICVSGCDSGVGPVGSVGSPILRSPLEAGLYNGITTALVTLTGGGEIESVGPLEGPSATIVISESGFPIEHGQELYDGLVISESVFDFAVSIEVSLNVVGNSLIVDKRMTGDGVEGFGQEIYVAMSGGRMSYSADVSLSISEEGVVLTFSGTETGVLSR